VLRVSIACLALPFTCGFAIGFFIAEGIAPATRIDTASFVATALSITALPTLGRIMMELDLTRTRLGGMLAVIFIAAMTTYQIGIFAIFGGFMMGVILYDEADFVAAWRARLGDFVTSRRLRWRSSWAPIGRRGVPA
jgi:Kef-type K+ transport system membrane component KefB